MTPPVEVIGVGDDGPAGLPPQTQALLAEADLVCGGARHLAALPAGPGERFVITKDLDGLVQRIAAARAAGRRVVVLASGDPLFYGVGATLMARLGREAVRVTPHVSAVQLAFARLGVPWHDAAVLSVHGRPLERVLGRAMASHTFAVLTDAVNTPAAVARALLEGGMEDAEAAVCEHLGGPRERVVRARLSAIAEQTFAPLNVLVVLRQPSAVRWGRPLIGQPESAYAHARGLITKAEVRAVSLGRLGLERAEVVWDVGAGSGAVAIEAASLRLDALVYAVERDAEQYRLLLANVRRYTAGNVRPVFGAAPAALADLPDPDAVFVGGTGGRLGEVLEAAGARLRPGGCLVLNLVLLEHLHAALAWLRARGWAVDVTQVAAARGTPTGEGVRLAALNPVFVLAARRPEAEEGG
jgi:precorrin-6Y C5,15-methyltransferase (decarboxylating)